MKNVLVLLIAIVLSLPGLFLLPAEDVKADLSVSSGNILYVDDSGGSTYTGIYSAMQDAVSGDTIYVAPGNYWLAFAMGKSDIQIIGNASQGEVRVSGDVEFLPFGLTQCSNFSIAGFTFVGQGHVITLNRCQNISFLLCRMESSSYAMGLLEGMNSDGISVGWCSFTSSFHDVHAFDLDGCDDFYAGAISVDFSGAGSGVLEAVNCQNVELDTVMASYYGNIVDAQSSSITTVDTTVPDGNVSVDGLSTMRVEWFRRIVVKEEDNVSRLEGVELRLLAGASPRYRTPHYGGTDAVSNVQGIYPDLPNLLQKTFFRTSSPMYYTNSMQLYYDGLDVLREIDIGEVAADNTNEIYVVFPDMRFPEPPANVNATTIDQDTIRIGFGASPSADVVEYEIYYKDTGWKEVLNTTVPGAYNITDLEPDTLHQFRVRAVDDAGLNSAWVDVENTTAPAVEGTITGTVMYVSGPLNGTAVANASVLCYNDHSNGTWEDTTDMTGMFELNNVDFEDDFHLMVVPPEVVEYGSTMSGYTNTTFDFDFHGDMDLDINVTYYEYVAPTSGSLSGMITYLDGPMEGANATSATVFLLNDTMVELGNFTVNETGMYSFEGVPFGTNYTMRITPENDVGWNGTESGYVKMVMVFDLLEDTVKDVALPYFEYNPPTSGDIFGIVTFEDGPKDGERASGVEVVLLNETGSKIRMMISNSTGHFRFENVPFGSGFSIEVSPKEEDLGEVDVTSGYLPAKSLDFDLLSGSKEIDLLLYYFEYIPEEEHPSVTILDEDGNPVPGVVVIVTINGTTYSAVTDENGVAEFDDMDGTEFPQGAKFKATKEGYDDIEWTKGEIVPEFVKEKEVHGGDLTLVLVIAIVVILIAIAAYFLLRRSAGSREGFPEE